MTNATDPNNRRRHPKGRIFSAFAAVATIGGVIALPNDVIDLGELLGFTSAASSTSPAPPADGKVPKSQAPAPFSEPPQQLDLPTAAAAPPPAARVTPTPKTSAQATLASTPKKPPARGGNLIITIRMGSSGKIGPSTYRTGSTPGANVDVFDDAGQLDSGCYPSWTLYRESAPVRTARNGRCTSGGITMFNFGDSLKPAGHYRLHVSIATDGNQGGEGSTEFDVTG